MGVESLWRYWDDGGGQYVDIGMEEDGKLKGHMGGGGLE